MRVACEGRSIKKHEMRARGGVLKKFSAPLARKSHFALASLLRSPRFQLCLPEIRKKICLPQCSAGYVVALERSHRNGLQTFKSTKKTSETMPQATKQ